MTAGRTYLSIGDVLTLLRQEFPDVTISKIRFLESQGLVNPERTPSGYRKFYDHDVERLRWVLRQQREHFLPLKVIKGRLEDETSSPDDSGAAISEAGIDSESSIGNGRRTAESGLKAPAGGREAKARTTTVGPEDRGVATDPSSDRTLEVPDHLPGFDPPAGGESLERHLAGDGAGQLVSRSVYSPPQSTPGRGPQHSRPAQSGPARPLGTTATGRASRQAGQAQPASEAPFGGGLKSKWAEQVGGNESSGVPGARDLSGPASRSGAHEATLRPGGGSDGPGPRRLTVSEIAAAAGLTESAIEELESYGILASRTVGGVAHFDESEITIARVAADFAKFGIEPRHLRLYKHASEREAGFVEQLVLPLLKQRNPEARKRAVEMVSDLTRLGEGLRAALVRRNLQDVLGG